MTYLKRRATITNPLRDARKKREHHSIRLLVASQNNQLLLLAQLAKLVLALLRLKKN